MSRRRYGVAAALLVIVAMAAVLFAARTNPRSLGGANASGDASAAPALDAKGWINTSPLTTADLAGKVVVYDFWTYSCVNCVRTIPYLRALYDRYKSDGLVVIGVHSPEFDFEKNHANVAQAVTKLGVDYPVALDDDMAIWSAFGNQYWPEDYIYNRDGKQASVHYGEGGYDDTENLVRTLLGVGTSSPRGATVNGQEGGTDGPATITAETYNGSERGGDRFVSPQPLVDGEATFTAPELVSPGDHFLTGPWVVSGQYVEAVGPDSAIVLRYYAGQVNLVMSTADGQPADVTVEVDGQSLTSVHVTAPDLYVLTTAASVGTHIIRVTAGRAGLRAFAFTFGG